MKYSVNWKRLRMEEGNNEKSIGFSVGTDNGFGGMRWWKSENRRDFGRIGTRI